jgi:hypothetical protein
MAPQKCCLLCGLTAHSPAACAFLRPALVLPVDFHPAVLRPAHLLVPQSLDHVVGDGREGFGNPNVCFSTRLKKLNPVLRRERLAFLPRHLPVLGRDVAFVADDDLVYVPVENRNGREGWRA